MKDFGDRFYRGTEGVYLPGKLRRKLWDLAEKTGIPRAKIVQVGLLDVLDYVERSGKDPKESLEQLERELMAG